MTYNLKHYDTLLVWRAKAKEEGNYALSDMLRDMCEYWHGQTIHDYAEGKAPDHAVHGQTVEQMDYARWLDKFGTKAQAKRQREFDGASGRPMPALTAYLTDCCSNCGLRIHRSSGASIFDWREELDEKN